MSLIDIERALQPIAGSFDRIACTLRVGPPVGPVFDELVKR